VHQFGNKLWRNYALAVRPDDQFRRRGHGIALKRALIEEARKSGIIAITSFVAWNNRPMLELNEKLGASILRLPDDDEFALCIVPVPSPPPARR
jgi:ribosomal protein S18 acetylase RimI-like enzyme